MDRLACVNVAALPLQLLLRAHPAWIHSPVAVVEDDRPQALVLYLNTNALKAGIRSGQRYANALAFSRNLRAGTISQLQIEESVLTLTDLLRRYSPNVEPSSEKPGVFWLDVQGLEKLYASLRTWADAVRAELRSVGMRATVAVGFQRFGAYALAMAHRGTVVCEDAAEEHAKVQRIPLSRLNFDPDARDRLHKLGITMVGDFLRLPVEGLRARFGEEIEALHQLAAGQQWAPLLPTPAKQPYERFVNFDMPESNADRLTFVVKRLLDELAMALKQQAEAVVDVCLRMQLEDRTTRIEHIRPAEPTLNIAQLLELIYLRLNTLQLVAGIVTLHVTAEACPATTDQHGLFVERRRDVHAANQALARVRAECGEQSVVRARICNAHLPAAQFAWEPLAQIETRAAPRVVARRPLVRRIYTQPVPLAISGDIHAHPKLALGKRVLGPYTLSGGWWGGGAHRDYYFVHTRSGELQWVYYDFRRQQFFLQGQVE